MCGYDQDHIDGIGTAGISRDWPHYDAILRASTNASLRLAQPAFEASVDATISFLPTVVDHCAIKEKFLWMGLYGTYTCAKLVR